MRFVSGIGGVLVAGAIIVLFALWNGGYLYRTKCPLATGGTQTSWTYGVNDVIPYTRSTSDPCISHTGTRLLLSSVGIARIHDFESTPPASTKPADTDAANVLAHTTDAITAEYARQRKQIAPLRAAIKTQGLTPALRQTLGRELEQGANRLESIKTTLDGSAQPSDAQLAETQRLLSLWLALEVQTYRIPMTATSKQQYVNETLAVAKKLDPVVRRLDALSVEDQARYPNITHWGFLHNQ
jgi:hypothetical protein